MKVFDFKQFSIQNDPQVMPLTIDPVILASWIDLKAEGKLDILDVGSGSGIISLILAQRFLDASIIALDISEHAYALSSLNVKNSPFHNRIQIVRKDFFCLAHIGLFDVVISNPPYFQNGYLPGESHKRQSRHGNNFPLDSFFQKAYAITNSAGVVAAVYPYTRWKNVRMEAAASGWFIEKLAFLKTNSFDTRKRVFAKWIKSPIAMPPEALQLEWKRKVSDESYQSPGNKLYHTLRGLYVRL